MKALKFTITVFIFLFCANAAHSQVREKLEKEINKILKYDILVDYEKVPGFVLGVVLEDSTYLFSYGTTEKGKNIKPDGNTLFEIGDVTKVFTASLLHQCVKEGQFKYEDPINDYLAESYKNKHTHNPTLLDLVTHTSGLPKMPSEFGLLQKEVNNPYANYTAKDLISFYREFPFPSEEEQKYLFSNVNFALIGELLQAQYDKTYEQLLTEKIIQPLDMNATVVSIDDFRLSQLAQGYSLAGIPVEPWEYKSFESSVGLKSTVNDLMKFIQAQIKDQQGFKDLHQSMYKTEIDKNTHIGKGWHVIKNKRYYDLIAHAGTTGGHRAFIGFVKESKTGIVVLSNSKTGMNGLGYLVLKMINHHWKKRKS